MVSIIICYASYSGNTKEVAELIAEIAQTYYHKVRLYRIDGMSPPPELTNYDLIMIGTFTWGKGATPIIVKNFIADVGYKPTNVAVFGTGDTQFGGDTLFCRAVDKIAKFYHSPYPTLKIEQSPRGAQEKKVRKWAKGVLQIDDNSTNKSKSLRASKPE